MVVTEARQELNTMLGGVVDGSYRNWTQHPNNPMAQTADKPLEPLEPAE